MTVILLTCSLGVTPPRPCPQAARAPKMALAQETVLVTGGNGYLGLWWVPTPTHCAPSSRAVKKNKAKRNKSNRAPRVTKAALDAGARVRVTVRDANCEDKTCNLKKLRGANERMHIVSLDLEKSPDADFETAVRGCSMVLHTASPFPLAQPWKNPDEVIKPALRGALCVARAIQAVGGVKRLVMTASQVTVAPFENKGKTRTLTENDFADVDGNVPYNQSTILAERGVRNYYNALVNPSWIMCTLDQRQNVRASDVAHVNDIHAAVR